MGHKDTRYAGRARVLLSAATVCAVVALGGVWQSAQAADGVQQSAEGVTWTTKYVAPGVQVRSATIENGDARPVWTVTVQAPATSRLTGAATWAAVGPRSWADDTAAKLRTAGFAPRVETVRWPRYADTPHGDMGQRVRVGSYATQADAQSAATKITAGFHPAVTWTGYDAEQPADRENVHVAVIDPRRFTGTVEGTHDGNVAQRVTTSSVAAKLGSLVGVNAGFFVTSDADGVQGTQSGLSADRGELQSMAAGSRASLIIADGGRHVRVADLTTTVTVRASKAVTYQAQGINRVPGLVRDCGRPGASPSELPWQDVTCHASDELVLFTDEFGAPLPTGPGTQVVLDADGHVVSAGSRGGSVPAHGRVLQGIGSAGDWLTAHARTGQRIGVDEDVRDTNGKRVELDQDDSIVSAAPTLVTNGRNHIDAAAEGVLDPKDLSFGYAWSNVRQPRTMAGVDAAGRLILATVDGRQTDGSEGFTLEEAADFMRSIDAVDALNLDGGGSTAMAVGGVLVNHPSDATGERAVGGTIQVLPGRTD
ncbi:phosphodiester glycosidase family protein [Streptomyces sp. V3I7]|uniref:phosphodiester glycosidase family protein n=1 Tax=Streptomyces sp. V3I7 TaxID=3042278 RepID=UPI002788DF4F|nr:phosphodiester glycosidase family protein [Streptomyces sp. V3I7]MDQ0994072.1 exopolysaccharide biosynthesis protein [Streptomyces sp. V3I7]